MELSSTVPGVRQDVAMIYWLLGFTQGTVPGVVRAAALECHRHSGLLGSVYGGHGALYTLGLLWLPSTVSR